MLSVKYILWSLYILNYVYTNLQKRVNYADDILKNDVTITWIKESCVQINYINSMHNRELLCWYTKHDMLERVCNYDIGR